jgi:hypothetical protein
MRKITLLFSFLAFAFISHAQTNLVVNPSFEEWTDGKPTPWYVVGSTPPTGYTMSSDGSITLDGVASCKMDVPSTASGTISVAQSVSIVAGKTYTLSMSFQCPTISFQVMVQMQEYGQILKQEQPFLQKLH